MDYDSVAPTYDAIYDTYERKVENNELRKLIRYDPSKTILDVWCGTWELIEVVFPSLVEKIVTEWTVENFKWKDQYAFYPLYDWSWTDVWKYIHSNWIPYNEIYDYQYQYGVAVRDLLSLPRRVLHRNEISVW